MMSSPPRLTLCTYLQSWHPGEGRLDVNVLVIPIGDPALALTTGWPGVPASAPFEGAPLKLTAHIGQNPDLIPTLAGLPAGSSFDVSPPAEQAAIFDFFRTNYDVTAPQPAVTRNGSATFLKYLPTSYRKSFAFTSPITALAVIDDSFHCARRCPPKVIPEPTPTDPRLNWGEVFAMLLRQPVVARAAGLSYSISIDVGDVFEEGGWLFFTLGTGGSFHEQVTTDNSFARWFGTRVPALSSDRPVFSAVLFPIAKDLPTAASFGPLDQAFPEAVTFDDGFAKIVHASQAASTDQSEDGDGDFPPPIKDDGIRLGWDDESIVMRLDRGISTNAPDGSPLPEAPTGAAGYRIDVRAPGDVTWVSLSRVEAAGLAIGDALLPPFDTELMTEVHPSEIGSQFWVPPYYTRWRGGSLVAETNAEQRIAGDYDTTPQPHAPVEGGIPPLRYGQSYEFRVRMVDATGGGPTTNETAFHPADAPIASHLFKRYVPLGRIAVENGTGVSPTNFSINRPQIGWPQAVFAGVVNARARFDQQAQDNQSSGIAEPLGVPDPDALYVEFRVMVLHPRFDPTGDDAGYAELYRTTRVLPPLNSAGEEVNGLDIDLSFVDCARLSDVTWPDSNAPPGSLSGDLVLPTARMVRIEARAVGDDDLSYYGDPGTREGETVLLMQEPLQQTAIEEVTPFFQDVQPSAALTSVFLRQDPHSENSSSAVVVQATPSAVLAQRLASAVDLIEDEGVLLDTEGKRTVFACRGLKHVAAPDLSSVQLTSLGELAGQWINVLQLDIERDWTWLGYQDASFTLCRTIKLAGTPEAYVEDPEACVEDLGIIGIKHTVSPRAARGEAERDAFGLCIIDAFAPMLDIAGLPQEILVSYELTAHLRNGDTHTYQIANLLPVSAPPQQTPTIVSTGHAFSDYQVIGDYEETGVRERVLWVEFAEPPADPRDAFFARVVASTTDPLLMPAVEPLSDPAAYDKTPLDPEYVRVIRPGQPRDVAGLGAAQRLIPCITAAGEKPRHFILPLPPTLTANAPELFGFFTYEFTVGHDAVPADNPWWVMAQARFGSSLILEGVQHPAPQLPLNVFRNKKNRRLQISSSFALPVKDGQNFSPNKPNTELWIIAYARLRQANGEGWRNVKLGQRRAYPQKKRSLRGSNIGGATNAEATFEYDEFHIRLVEFGLPEETPLTFVAVELLPEPNGRFQDPLSGDLGDVRILRTSRLVSAGDTCCP